MCLSGSVIGCWGTEKVWSAETLWQTHQVMQKTSKEKATLSQGSVGGRRTEILFFSTEKGSSLICCRMSRITIWLDDDSKTFYVKGQIKVSGKCHMLPPDEKSSSCTFKNFVRQRPFCENFRKSGFCFFQNSLGGKKENRKLALTLFWLTSLLIIVSSSTPSVFSTHPTHPVWTTGVEMNFDSEHQMSLRNFFCC